MRLDFISRCGFLTTLCLMQACAGGARSRSIETEKKSATELVSEKGRESGNFARVSGSATPSSGDAAEGFGENAFFRNERENFSPRSGKSGIATFSNDSTCDLRDWSLEDKVGQLVWIGVRRPEEVLRFKPSGVILFKWNYKNLEQLRDFNLSLQAMARKNLKAPLFIGIDHEGGKIDRLGYSLTPFPDAASMGAVKDEEMVYRAGKIMGEELAAVGINTNLAPVLDLGDARTFLENRIWGQQPEAVAEKTRRFIQGLQDSQIFPVAKHFPGHGGSRTDAHFQMPVIRKSFARLWDEDLKPFQRAIQNDLPALMTAHVEVPAVDRGPASLSRAFLEDILRKKLGYRGLVVTDDLEMGGAYSKAGGLVEDVALKAFRSGTDQLLVVWSNDSKEKILSKIKNSLRDGSISESEVDAKICRVLAAKQRWLKDSSQDGDWRKMIRRPSSLKLSKEIAKQSLLWIAGPQKELLTKLKHDWDQPWKVAVGFPSEARFWKKVRRQDQVFVLGRRPDEKKKTSLAQFLNSAGREQVKIVLTGPRHSLGDEAYQTFLGWLSTQASGKAPRVLWLHKGMNPVQLKAEGEKMSLGIVSLNGGMTMNLEAFFEWVQQPSSSTDMAWQKNALRTLGN